MKAIQLLDEDCDRMQDLNAHNYYGLTEAQLRGLANKHRRARLKGDAYQMALIEYRLTDINYHSECALFERGRYDEAILKYNIKQS